MHPRGRIHLDPITEEAYVRTQMELQAELEGLRSALTDFRAAIDAQRKLRNNESEHDHKLANLVLDDVIFEYELRFTDDPDDA